MGVVPAATAPNRIEIAVCFRGGLGGCGDDAPEGRKYLAPGEGNPFFGLFHGKHVNSAFGESIAAPWRRRYGCAGM